MQPRFHIEHREENMDAAARGEYWDILATLHWICTRDEGKTEEKKRTLLGKSTAATLFDFHQLLAGKYDFMVSGEPVSCQAGQKSLDANGSSMFGIVDSLNYLLAQVHRRRIRIKALKCEGRRVKEVSVSPADLNDLEFRIISDHAVAELGLWSRSRNALIWKSPKFSRADILRVWPARKKTSAEVSAIILRHLQTIMTPHAPLTKADAQKRCLAEVRHASPGAFQKAWSSLDPSCKRRRGNHGAGRGGSPAV